VSLTDAERIPQWMGHYCRGAYRLGVAWNSQDSADLLDWGGAIVRYPSTFNHPLLSTIALCDSCTSHTVLIMAAMKGSQLHSPYISN